MFVEVRPPGSSSFGTLQHSGLDLRRSVLNDFELSENRIAGTVQQETDVPGGPPQSVAGAQLTFTARNAVIPGRVAGVRVQSDNAGTFSALLPEADQSESFLIEALPPAPLPPLRLAQNIPAGSGPLAIVLPAPGTLLHRLGTATQGGAPLTSASVLAVDAEGEAIAAPTTVDAAGGFSLTLSPGAPSYWLRISGPAQAGATPAGAAPIPAFDPVGPFAATDLPAASFPALPAVARLTGQVVDGHGLPVVAQVYARSRDGSGWMLSASATTDASGTFALSLLAGSYDLEAVPGAAASDSALSGDQQLDVPAGNSPVTLVCPPKVFGSGALLRPDGTSAGADTQITARRVPDRLISGRVAQVSTLKAGVYQLTGDPGVYRVEFVPPSSSGLPRRQVALTLLDSSSSAAQVLPTVTLAPPLEAVGTVHGPGDARPPVAGATVDFFAVDASGEHALLIGSGVTDDQGHYRALLPDVGEPTALTP